MSKAVRGKPETKNTVVRAVKSAVEEVRKNGKNLDRKEVCDAIGDLLTAAGHATKLLGARLVQPTYVSPKERRKRKPAKRRPVLQNHEAQKPN